MSEETLPKLADALAKLVAILKIDPTCQWTAKLEGDLENCNRLIQSGWDKENTRMLSTSIRHVFGGMGSFNDYAPGKYDSATGRYTSLPGTENFQDAVDEVFDLAVQLITHASK